MQITGGPAQALEEKTKAELAKLQSDTAAPSSFLEEGAPDSFADLDAKLKVRGSSINLTSPQPAGTAYRTRG